MAKASTLAPSSLVTPPTTEWEQSSIASLTSTDMSSAPQSDDGYSLIDSLSELAVTGDEAEPDGNDDGGDGDLTVLPEASSQISHAPTSASDARSARPSRLRSQHRPALSDIDSGNEVDIEPESDDDAVSLAGAPGLPEQSTSRQSMHTAVSQVSAASLLPPVAARGVAAKPQGRTGWILPEYTFMQWVMLP